MFCTKCGQKIPDNSSFCTRCGGLVSRPVNQENHNRVYPNNPYGWQPRGEYLEDGYRPQRTINAPGKAFLIIVAILVLIGGVERLSVVLENIAYLRYIRVLGYEFIVVFAVKIVCAAASMFGGIRGIVYCGRPDKGKAVVIDGIVIVALRVADWICVATLTRGLIDEFIFTWKNVIFGLVMPILLIVSGYINKNATKNTGGGA